MSYIAEAQMSDHDFHGHGGGLLRRTPSKTNTANDRARRARTTGKRTTNATNHGGTDSVTLRSLTIPQKLAIAERISVELNSTLTSERATTTAAEDEMVAKIEEASMHAVAVAKWRDVLEREVAGRHTLNKGDVRHYHPLKYDRMNAARAHRVRLPWLHKLLINTGCYLMERP